MRADPPGTLHDWLDDEAGPVVRPYAMTGGRVRPAAGFDLVAFVFAEPDADPDRHELTQPEHRRILRLATEPISVAEISAHLDLALGVVRVLLGDLLDARLIAMHEPPATSHYPDDNILKAVVNGLRAL
ncbi:DUF742 domain-containing protein [Micromonospora sp. CPCC 206060]|uniref:DUF742 domain-containing protein n=1 Tax=Micromonospora sp. CPCC 206060 TaxID=3122406 RepID=UPI002FF1A348